MTMRTEAIQRNGNAPETVIEHVLLRLRQIGITEVFGVAGDFAFSVHDAICKDPDMRWVGCCNELNAAYAADGCASVGGDVYGTSALRVQFDQAHDRDGCQRAIRAAGL